MFCVFTFMCVWVHVCVHLSVEPTIGGPLTETWDLQIRLGSMVS